MVVSATLHLPIERPPATAADVRAIAHELREMTYHPERYLTGGADILVCPEKLRRLKADKADKNVCPTAVDLIAAKRRWIETAQTRGNARQRCQRHSANQCGLAAPAGRPTQTADRASSRNVRGFFGQKAFWRGENTPSVFIPRPRSGNFFQVCWRRAFDAGHRADQFSEYQTITVVRA